MSFLTTQPEELAAAAGKLETIGSAMVAQNAAAAAPTTTGVIPAAADEISVLQASLFTAYGTLYQQVSAEAAAVYDLFVKTLGVSAGTYAATEAANSSAAASPLSGIASILGSTPGKVPSWISDIANIFNIGAGNWASAASDLLGLASGGLLPAAEEAALEEGLEGAGLSELGAAEAAVGGAPIAAGLGAHALRPAAPAHLGQRSGAEHRLWQYGRLGGGVGVGQQHFGARARGHRQPCPDRDRIAKARSWFQCGHADPRRSLAAIYLHAFAGGVAQLRQYRRARHQQWIVDMGREFGDGRTEPPVAILAAPQQAMHLQRGRQPVCGGPGQVGSIAEFGQSAGRFRDRVQHANGFVEDTDTAMLSHKEIIASRILR